MADTTEAGDFPLGAYLDRIGLDAPPPVSVDGIARLVQAHRRAIPFENLDIILGHGVSLDPDAIFDKIVHRRRGGYCFEQNALFHRALVAMGFEGRPLMGRVWLRVADDEPPPRTHQFVLVTLEGRQWIVDVGFGGSLTPPLPLVEGETGTGPDGVRFRLTHAEKHGWVLARLGAPSYLDVPEEEAVRWQRQYSFTTDPVFRSDLETGNHWTATRPGTPFTSLLMVHRVTAEGFASLDGRSLRLRDGERARNLPLPTPQALGEALDRHFDILLGEDELVRLHRFGVEG